jgi:hypothetical protein
MRQSKSLHADKAQACDLQKAHGIQLPPPQETAVEPAFGGTVA